MFGRIFRFELACQLRHCAPYICFALLAAFGFLGALAAAKTATPTNPLQTPYMAALSLFGASMLGLFVPIAILARVALRDHQTRMDALIRVTPVGTATYLMAKFSGAFVVALVAVSGIVIGMTAGARMPWLDPQAIAPFSLATYGNAVAIILIPNLLITGAVFFAIACATRSMLATALGLGLIVILYVGALVSITGLPALRPYAALIDPFGHLAFLQLTRYWTAFEHGTRLIPLEGALLWNRMLWLAIAAALMGLSCFLFGRPERGSRSVRRRPAQVAILPPIAGKGRTQAASRAAGAWTQLVAHTRLELRAIVRSWVFLTLVALGVAACIGGLVSLGRLYGTPVLPVSRAVAEIVGDASAIVALIVAWVFSAELVWRERACKIAEIIDSTPAPNLVFLGSKIVALALVIATVLVSAMATGIGFQLANGITRIELDFYLVKLFVVTGVPMLLVGVLSIFVQTLVNHKFLGHAILLVVLAGPAALAQWLEISDPLFDFAHVPLVPLSDLNRFGHFLKGALWFEAYWVSFAVLFTVATLLLWPRGVAASFLGRLRRARHAFTPAAGTVAAAALLAAAGTGGFIYWNTYVLDARPSATDAETWQVAYEKRYGALVGLPQPRVSAVEMAVDLRPESRGYSSRGRYLLINRTDAPIETVHVQFPHPMKIDAVELADSDLVEAPRGLNHFVFKPHAPLAPGETRALTFALSQENPGFAKDESTSRIVHNGTFLYNAQLAPSIGVSRALFLGNDAKRRGYGLEPLDQAPTLDAKTLRHRNYISADADFVRFAMTVSTSPDQIALAPGDLKREWTEGGRRFFRYEMGAPIVNFWAVVSARYMVARDKWNDVDIQVYHHAAHTANVARMVESVKQSLAYYSAKFGPYQHRQLRIVEFPGYFGTFAQSFPSTIPYSEGFGFIADNRDPSRIDYTWNVTAHEVAHQWWAHQVVGADLPGATMLSETLAEYSALMVMEHRYGPDHMRKFLKYELDTYLSGRGRGEEVPIVRVKAHHQHIHYQKGALVMYALKDTIGEEAVNRALATLVKRYKYRSDPYPVSADLIQLIRREALPEHQQLITDLFEKIVLWELGVSESEATPTEEGKWRVRIKVGARKLEADPRGKQEERPLDQAIDIGLFAADPASAGFAATDVILLEKRRIVSGPQTLELVVDRKPAFVGIDPYGKLIQRSTERNVTPVGAPRS